MGCGRGWGGDGPFRFPGGGKGGGGGGRKRLNVLAGPCSLGVRWEGREGGRVPDETCMKSASGRVEGRVKKSQEESKREDQNRPIRPTPPTRPSAVRHFLTFRDQNSCAS